MSLDFSFDDADQGAGVPDAPTHMEPAFSIELDELRALGPVFQAAGIYLDYSEDTVVPAHQVTDWLAALSRCSPHDQRTPVDDSFQKAVEALRVAASSGRGLVAYCD